MTRIEWICTGCHQPIAAGTGYIAVDDGAAYRRHLAEEAVPVTPPGVVDMAALLALPDPEPWFAVHSACDPNPDRDDYWIAVERIATVGDLLQWNAHVHEKRWIDSTDWDLFLERIGRAL